MGLDVREASLIALGFCLVAAGVTCLRAATPRRLWLWLVAALMAADLGLVAGTSSLVTTPSNAVPQMLPSEALLRRPDLPNAGRPTPYSGTGPRCVWSILHAGPKLASNPSRPFLATSTEQPSFSRIRRASFWFTGLSSASRIVSGVTDGLAGRGAGST